MTAATVETEFRHALRAMLKASHLTKPSDLAAVVNESVRPIGVDITVYLVDHEQRALHPLPEPAKPAPPSTPIDGTLAGRAFTSITSYASGQDPERLWVPVLDGTARLGVLDVALPDQMSAADEAVRDGCEAIAGLVGHLIQSKTTQGDSLELVRRSRPMGSAPELLWTIVPPTTFACEELAISAVVEPCYEAGGDAFDYAVDGNIARLTILDAVGHGLRAGVTSAVALAAMRAARRGGEDLLATARAADEAIVSLWSDAPFATAVLCELDLDGGRLRYVNAGHPPPVLLRGGRVVASLSRGRRLPLGLHDDSAVEISEEALEPGDRLLFYTDGVTEARGVGGELFGLPRLVGLAERQAASGLPTAEILRRLAHAVLDHQNGQLHDDATLMLVEWSSAAARRAAL
jgi:phosphoserine phosphatase RsbU/P